MEPIGEPTAIVSGEPHWAVLLFLGWVLGMSGKAWNIIKFVFRYYTEKSYFEGTWYSYHLTYIRNQPIVVSSEIRVTNGFKKKYQLNLTQKNTNLIYTGWAELEGDNIIISFKSKDHPERLTARLPYVLASQGEMFGLWLSYDHDRKIASGAIMLSKVEVDTLQHKALLKSGIKNETNLPLMHSRQ